jgi:hypothetical protein
LPLSKSSLKTALLNQVFKDPLDETGWALAISSYISEMVTPPVGATTITYLETLGSDLASSMASSTDAVTTFVPVDDFLSSIAGEVETKGLGTATTSGDFGSYALDGVIDTEDFDSAADKIADNVHNYITDIENFSFTATSASPVPWS